MLKVRSGIVEPELRSGSFTRFARFRLAAAFASVTALMGMLLFAWSRSEQRHYHILHQGVTNEYLRLTKAIMDSEAAPLATLAKDYTQWDDMVRFVKTADMPWAEENLVPALPTYGADAGQVYRVDGSRVYANHVERQGWLDAISPPAGFLNSLVKGPPQQHYFQFVNGELIEVRASTIQPSADNDRKTPAQGFYLVYRAWDVERLGKLTRATGMNASVVRFPSVGATLTPEQIRSGTIEVFHPVVGLDGRAIGAIRLADTSQVLARAGAANVETLRLVASAIVALLATALTAVALWCFRPLAGLASFLDDRDTSHLATVRQAGAEYARLAERVESSFAQQAELERARDRAQEASRQKSEFLANMSHEIRTPLNGVLGMLGFLEESPLTPEQREWLFTARTSADTLLGVIHDILDLSKIEAGHLSIETQSFDLGALMPLICAGPAAQCAQRDIEFRCEVAPDARRGFDGDVLRIQQVLGNLLSNAMKFTHRGSIVVSVDRVDEQVRFTVRDTGIGIPPDRLEAIFESFVQADGSTTRHYGGTGLGLTIVRRLCDLMGGHVTVSSALGKGSEFTVLLPLTEVDVEAAESAPPLAPVDGVRVLLAEDNEVNRKVALRVLEGLGCEVFCVTDGRMAVEAWSQREFDLVLMDVQMPIMDGLEACREIRRLEAGASTRTWIVALTANVLTEDVSSCLAAGMDGHLGKPFRANELRALLANRPGQMTASP